MYKESARPETNTEHYDDIFSIFLHFKKLVTASNNKTVTMTDYKNTFKYFVNLCSEVRELIFKVQEVLNHLILN